MKYLLRTYSRQAWAKRPWIAPSTLCWLSAALYIGIHPIFRIGNLFRHQPLDSKVVFSFPPPRPPDNPYSFGPEGNPIPLDPQHRPIIGVQAFASGVHFVTARVDLIADEGAVGEILLTQKSDTVTHRLTLTSHMRQGFFRLDPHLIPNERYTLAVKAIGGTVQLERLNIYQIPLRQAPPALDLVAAILFLIAVLTRNPFSRKSLYYVIATGLPLIAVTLCCLMRFPVAQSPWLWFSGAVSYLFFQSVKGRRSFASTSTDWLWAILILGFILRWGRLMPATLEPIESDPSMFYQYAAAMDWRHPFATIQHREPLMIWILYLSRHLLGPNFFQHRVASVLLSMATVYLTYRLSWQLSKSRLVAWLSAVLMACNNFSVFMSILSERTQSFEPLTLLLCLSLMPAGLWTTKQVLRSAGIATLASLNWLIACAAQLPLLLAILAVLRKIPWRQAMMILITTYLFLSPYGFVMWKTQGSPFGPLNMHASYYRRADLEGIFGGDTPRVTWFDYLIREQGPIKLVHQTAIGYVNILFNPFDRFNRIFLGGRYWTPDTLWIFPIFLLGFFRELWKRRYLSLVFFVALLNVGPYFMKEIISPRYIFFVAPFFAYWTALGAEQIWTVVRKKVK